MSLVIRPVTTKSERKAFIDFPYRLYAKEPTWVPPLRFERKKHMDPAKSPFFEHAEVQLFLAERDGRVVFLYAVQPGAADRAYGVQVARLAGLPPWVADRAV